MTTTTYTNDGSGNQTTAAASSDDDDLEPLSETDQLLKKGEESTQETSSDEEGDEHTGLLGTIVEGYEYIAEHAQEAAVEIKEKLVDGYENVVEGVENFTENASEMVQDVGQAMAEEAHDYKEALLDGLHEKDDGESVIYEMGMARNLSILPSDMEIFAEEMILPEEYSACQVFPAPRPGHRRKVSQTHTFIDEEGQPQEVTVEKTIYTGKIPFHAYATLFLAVVCLSSIGPSLDMQKETVPTLKIYWRMTGTYLVLAPLALRSIYKEGFPKLTSVQICTFVMSAFCYAFFTVTFVIALEYTSVGNVVIFSNSQSLLLLFGKVLVGQAVSRMEGSGAIVAFIGAILCASDSSASTGNTFSTNTSATVVWAGVGDILAILSALGGVGYLVFAKTLRDHVPNVFVFMVMNMFGGSMFVLLYLSISGQYFTFDRHFSTGLWGFMNIDRMDRLPLEVYMVCVCNLLGTMGYLRSMQYFSNLVITVATLLEPIVASFMAYLLQVGLLPGWVGWIGNFTVMAGTVMVIYPNAHKQSSDMH